MHVYVAVSHLAVAWLLRVTGGINYGKRKWPEKVSRFKRSSCRKNIQNYTDTRDVLILQLQYETSTLLPGRVRNEPMRAIIL